jgi:hypothetical protein
MNHYKAQYIDLNIERAALFKAIRDQYHCRDVLYPGCSVHITPSLYFPHVVYVDQSDAAAQFFFLLISLFAGGIARSCTQYLKPGGLLLTNNHQGDAVDAFNNGNYELITTVRFQKDTYSFSEDIQGTNFPARKLNKYLKQVNDSVEYLENETYYVFERLHAARE